LQRFRERSDCVAKALAYESCFFVNDKKCLYLHKSYSKEERNRINKNRKEYGLLSYQEQIEFMKLKNDNKDSPIEKYIKFKSYLNPIKWTGIKLSDISKIGLQRIDL